MSDDHQIDINYVIGHYWDDTNHVGAYMIHSSEVMHGTIDEAKQTLEYVKQKSPEKDWRIFQLIQVLT